MFCILLQYRRLFGKTYIFQGRPAQSSLLQKDLYLCVKMNFVIVGRKSNLLFSVIS